MDVEFIATWSPWGEKGREIEEGRGDPFVSESEPKASQNDAPIAAPALTWVDIDQKQLFLIKFLNLAEFYLLLTIIGHCRFLYHYHIDTAISMTAISRALWPTDLGEPPFCL